MSKVTYIHGTGPKYSDLSPREIKQRSANVQPLSFYDTANLSEGQVLAQIVKDRYAMLSEFYPEVAAYDQGKTLIENALYQGLHGVGRIVTGVKDPRLDAAARVVSHAKKMTRPASGFFTWQQKGMFEKVAGIGTIPKRDCNQVFSQTPGSFIEKTKAKLACEIENEYRQLFNDHMAKIAHQPLYNFQTDLNAQPNLVAIKGNAHKALMAIFSGQSKISRLLLDEFQFNGIMYSNANVANVGPLTPIETIEAVKVKAVQEGIGFIDPVTATFIVTVALPASFAAAKTFIGVLKGKSVFDALKETLRSAASVVQSFGNIPGFGPEVPDWGKSILDDLTNDPPPVEDCPEGFYKNPKGECVEIDKAGFQLGTKELLIGAGLLLALSK